MQQQKRKMCKKEEYTIMRIWILRVIPVSTTPISPYSCCFFFMQFATPTKSGNATHIWKERHSHTRILLCTTALNGHKMSLLLYSTGRNIFWTVICSVCITCEIFKNNQIMACCRCIFSSNLSFEFTHAR